MFGASNDAGKGMILSWTAWNHRKRKEDFKHVEVENYLLEITDYMHK